MSAGRAGIRAITRSCLTDDCIISSPLSISVPPGSTPDLVVMVRAEEKKGKEQERNTFRNPAFRRDNSRPKMVRLWWMELSSHHC